MIEDGLYFSISDNTEEFRFNNSGEYNYQEVSYIRYDDDKIHTFWFGRLEEGNGKFKVTIDKGSWKVEQQNAMRFTSAELVPINEKKISLEFNGIKLTFKFIGKYFREEVKIEYYREGNFQHQKVIDTNIIRENHPPGTILKHEDLSIKEVFKRAGIKLTNSGDAQISNADVSNLKWNNTELNDLMNRIRSSGCIPPISWNIWCFMAGEHENERYQGVMFDDDKKDTFHRQGAAVFQQNIIYQLSHKIGEVEDWIKRMKHFITIHEIGHTFNLVHSFFTSNAKRWLKADVLTDVEQYSFMDYPWRVNRRIYDPFFDDFDYKFNKNEVRFLRHAPEAFIKMGGSAWETNYAFSKQESSFFESFSKFKLKIEVGQKERKFECLEPVVIEYSLKNISFFPARIDQYLTMENDQFTLSDENLHVAVRKKKTPEEIREVHSGFHKFERIDPTYLWPCRKMTGSVFIGGDHENWIIQDPGAYEIQATLFTNRREIHSNILEIYVDEPKVSPGVVKGITDNLYTLEMARAMLLDGSRAPNPNANEESEFERFKEISDQLGSLKLAIHINIALAMPLRKPYKYIDFETKEIKELPADLDQAINYFEKAFANLDDARVTLGKTDFKYYHNVYQELKAQQP